MYRQDILFDEERDTQIDSRPITKALQSFLNSVEANTPDEKLEKILEFMEQCIKEDGSFDRKEFWRAKGLCIQLFNETIDKSRRFFLWKKFTECIRQGRTAEKLLEKNTYFLSEHLSKAIDLLQEEMEQGEQNVKHPELTQKCIPFLKSELIGCERPQSLFKFYNTLVLRYKDLKNELIQSQMHFKEKKRLFERLDQLALPLFASRKKYEQQVSEHFARAIDHFCQATFDGNKTIAPIYILKEQVKMVQNLAKELSLSSVVFKSTRLKLSELWGRLKDFEKERKKESVEKRRFSKQNLILVENKINELEKRLGENTFAFEQFEKEEAQVIRYMRTLELEREDRAIIKERLQKVKRPFIERQAGAIEKENIKGLAQTDAKQMAFEELDKETDRLIQMGKELDIEDLELQFKALGNKINKTSLEFFQKVALEKKGQEIKTLIHQKKEEAIKAKIHEHEDLESLKEFKKHLEGKKQDLKKEFETQRKDLKNCGLDVEKSVQIQNELHSLKENLEKITAQLQEIDQKIHALS